MCSLELSNSAWVCTVDCHLDTMSDNWNMTVWVFLCLRARLDWVWKRVRQRRASPPDAILGVLCIFPAPGMFRSSLS